MYFTAKRNSIQNHEPATMMKGKQSKSLLCIPEWFFFLKMPWGFDSFWGEDFWHQHFFASWDIHVYSEKKFRLLTEILKLQTQCDTTGPSWSWEKQCQYLLLGVLIPIVLVSVDPFCLRQKIKTFSTPSTWLDSAGISLFFTILKRQSW